MWQVSRAERLDPDQVKALQQQRLRKLVAHVLAKSRFYAAYYREHGITADVLDEIQLADLPPINKEIMMANFDALVCDPAITRAGVEKFLSDSSDLKARYQGRYHVAHTSGSTGSLGIFVYGRRDWDLMQALVGARILRYRPTIGRIRHAFILKTDGHYGGVKLCQGAPGIAFRQQALSIAAPIDQTLREVQRFQPHLLAGYGSGLCLLAQQQLAGRIHIRPARVMSSGEPLTEEMARTIRDAFQVTPIDVYAASESLAIGISCCHNRGIHLFDDWHGIELTDDKGRPAQPGCCGRLVLTNLYNYTQPLIRYQMSDEIRVADGGQRTEDGSQKTAGISSPPPASGRCPCGSPFQLVERIAGRTEEILWFERPDGTSEYLHPFIIAGLHVPGIERWQIVQTGANELLVRLKSTLDAETAVRRAREEIAAILRCKRLEQLITTRIVVVDEIPNDPNTGKCRFAIPLKDAQLCVSTAS
jgi:phenylacetate-coenzyme A ligase PaaK-like adenylate-forming protein